MVAYAAAMLCNDYATLGVLELWTVNVLVMDVLLVFDAPPWAPRAVLAAALAWVAASTVEANMPFGV
eukprot:gene6498-7790_t